MKWKKNRYLLLTLIIALSLVYSCEKETIWPVKIETASFKTDIVPIFSKKCITCHGGSLSPDLRAANAYSSLTRGNYYNLQTPTESKIYLQLTTNPTHLEKASDTEKQMILIWIKLGAKNE